MATRLSVDTDKNGGSSRTSSISDPRKSSVHHGSSETAPELEEINYESESTRKSDIASKAPWNYFLRGLQETEDTCFYPLSSSVSGREGQNAVSASPLNPSSQTIRPTLESCQQEVSTPRRNFSQDKSLSISGSRANNRATVSEHREHITGTLPGMDNTASQPTLAESNAFSSFSYRGKDHKTRYFGRSHWATTLDMFPDLKTHLQKYSDEKHKETHHTFDEYLTMKRLKHDMRAQKSDPDVARYPSVQRLEEFVPSRRAADSLVDLYFSSFETTFRILHKPQFMSEYMDYWDTQRPPSNRASRTLFVAKLLALMACSSNFYEAQTTEETNSGSVSIAARAWFEGVVSWINSTTGYARLNLDMIQIKCLMVLGAQAVAYEGDLAWMTAGSLIREAITMGLHTDPSNFSRVSTYMAEMRRRIWLTVVELDLQSALQNGTPMGISWDEMDVSLPLNIDDERLQLDSIDPPISSPISTATRTSFQLILAQSLQARMATAKCVSNLRCPLDYQEVLSISNELMTGLANIPLALRSEETAESTEYSTFQKSFYLFLIYRCLLALHRPFLLTLADTSDPTFEYSRRLCVQASTALLAQLELSDLDAQSVAVTNQSYPHLLRLRGGMFRDDMFHAAATLCFELCLKARDTRIPSLPGSRSSFIDYGIGYHMGSLWQSVENAVQYFEFKVRAEKQGCKALMFLHLIVTSARNHNSPSGNDPVVNLDDACPKASRRCRELLLADTTNASDGASTHERPDYADAADIHASSPIDATETETIQHMPNQGHMITPLSISDSIPEVLDPSLDWNLLLDSFDPYSTTRWPLMDPLM
ncbi:fungal specific transcription factor domain-containing protein [Aspergillus affinis]|uniref:fungal specific transcription factor domain-containing protein n=1 Tax=Aspergillus affinis TaxID=1070780 RepID=UPI0022FE77E4|nr:uncharacterized protein KD926_009725 [Aspergillus affinis]KAI9039283.1 hypothetical protein KD926_009725 [Aspergillus affinis]